MAPLIMLTASTVVAIQIDSTKLFQNAMESGKHSDKNYKYQDEKIIIILMKETIDIHPTITIINIINLCNNNTSQVITITTTTMIMTKDKRISYNNSYEDTKKYVHIQR